MYLGADVEVQQLQAVQHADSRQAAHHGQDLPRAQAKFGALPRWWSPQWPACAVDSLARTPKTGVTPMRAATSSTTASS